MTELTTRQADVLDWIKRYIERHRMSPTVREICTGMKFRSTNAAHKHLTALVAKGAITRIPLSPRSIVVVD